MKSIRLAGVVFFFITTHAKMRKKFIRLVKIYARYTRFIICNTRHHIPVAENGAISRHNIRGPHGGIGII